MPECGAGSSHGVVRVAVAGVGSCSGLPRAAAQPDRV